MGQYKVPQNTQREDKVFGPFSVRQFIYLIAAAMTAYLVYSLVKGLSGSGTTGFMFGFIAFGAIGAFAFVQVQGKELPDFVSALVVYLVRPQKRVWKRDIFTKDIAYIPPKKEKEEEVQPKDPHEIKSELEKLSHVLDTRGWAELAVQEEQKEIETIYQKEIPEEVPAPSNPTIVAETPAAEIRETMVPQGEEIEMQEAKPSVGLKAPQELVQENKVRSNVTPKIIRSGLEQAEEKNKDIPAINSFPEPKFEEPKPITSASQQPITSASVEDQAPETKQLPEQSKEESPTQQQPQPEAKPQIVPEQTINTEKVKKPEAAPPMTKYISEEEQAKREKEIEKKMAEMEARVRSELEKKIRKEIEAQNKEKKQSVKELKGTVTSLEKIAKNPPAPVKKKKIKKKLFHKSAVKPSIDPYAEAYSLSMSGRITTPRFNEPSTTIRVDESELEDVLEDTEEIKSIKKEMAEIDKAMKEKNEKQFQRPKIIKEGEAFI